MGLKTINPDTLEDVINAAGPDEEQDQADFDSEYSGSQPVAAATDEHVEKNLAEELAETDDEISNETETADKTPSTTEQQPDPFAEINAAIRSLNGRFGTINSKMTQLMDEAKKSTEQEGGDSPSTAAIKEAMKDGDKMKALRAEYSEWAEAFDEKVMAASEYLNKKIPDAYEIRQMAVMDLKHDDWEETINTKEFNAWLVKQEIDDPDTFMLSKSPKGKDGVALLDKWEENKKKEAGNGTGTDGSTDTTVDTDADPKPGKTAAQKRLESAVAPTKGTRQRVASKSEQAEFEEGFKSG